MSARDNTPFDYVRRTRSEAMDAALNWAVIRCKQDGQSRYVVKRPRGQIAVCKGTEIGKAEVLKEVHREVQ